MTPRVMARPTYPLVLPFAVGALVWALGLTVGAVLFAL